ncbi:unnamed protein product [Adineta steineri]|uniref:Uncharacterized protein n=1 Tax=Adineta steineri TaxID=433720 RepID=A0A819KAZ2_9BILA|nr:unnamed protein product [Adineta steineri]CAF1380733.1 unnamed protein product [Adineta steineri]CAF3945900.1 unnamed protein product [Adineta steineri]CAF4029405.1 unnamed protein product [Adineta steineri]
MKSSIYLLILFIFNVSTDNSPSFCLCALKDVLKDYALLTTDRNPPRYYSSDPNDIGFYILPSKWKPVNNATWSELGAMINAPSGMYTYISLDGIHPLDNGLTINSFRSAYLADILAEYRLITDKVETYHENMIKSRTETCLQQSKKSVIGSDLKDKWARFFVPPVN